MAERRVINGYIVERQADGSLVTIGPAGGTAPQMPVDPTYQYGGPQASATLTKTQLDNQISQATINAAIKKANAEAAKAAADAASAEIGLQGDVAKKAKRDAADPALKLRDIIKTIDGIAADAKDNGGWGETGWLGSWLRDRPGSAAYDLQSKIKKIDANSAFSELQQMRDASPTGGALGGIAVPELELLKSTIASLDPNMSQDEFLGQLQAARDHYAGLVSRIDPAGQVPAKDYANQTSAQILGKRDDMAVAGNVQGPDQADRSSVYLGDAPDPNRGGFAPYGAKFRTVDNPALAGVNEAIGKMIAQGATREQIAAFAASKGVTLPPNTQWGQETPAGRAWLKQNPGKPYPVNVDDMVVPMSGFEQFRNNLPQTPVGTALATAANAGGFGIPQMIAGGEGLDYLRSVNPKSAFAGDVAGVIGGTAALGKAGSTVAGKLAPSLLGGGAKSAAARQLATDAAYGGIYGGVTEGTPEGALMGAGTAAAGSLLGQGIGAGIGKALKGASMNPFAEKLRGMGVNNLTIGQMLGGKAKGLEDAMTSAPILGDIVNARRVEGFNDFNRAAFEQAGAPIGAQVNDIAEAGIDALRPQVSRAYDRATENVTVPLDPRYAQELAQPLAEGSQLVGDYGAGFTRMVNNRVKPALDTGELSGANYQNMMRAMRDARGSVQGQPFAQDFIDPVKAMEVATRGLMERRGGEGVITGLRVADDAYRNQKVLEKAVEAARNGSRSGEVGTFTPSQLNDASVMNARKFGGTGATQNRPFYDLATAGQEVLPSTLPDSGTAKRVMSLALPASLGGAGGGLGFISGDPSTAAQGAGAGLTIGTLLALGGTKGGQKALEAALFKRPKAIRRAGGIFGSRKGQQALSGLVTAPLLIE